MIKLIILDVDGTMTNGDISYTTNAQESKTFNVKDGLAIASWNKKLKKKTAIITGRSSTIVEKRAKELGVDYLYQNIDNKDKIIEEILKKENITWDNIAAIGDDLNDYKMLSKAKLSFAPKDAVEDIKQITTNICTKNGGDGAVREMIEYILKYNNMDSLKSLWV